MEDERSEVGLSLIKQLAASDKAGRDKALSLLLKSWLPSQTQVSDDLMKKLWKGLFYCVWHADKLPVQSHLADFLSHVVHELPTPLSLHYFEVFLLTMRREWTGIDVLRLDKFYLLIRRFMNNFFALLRNQKWDLEILGRFVEILEKRVFFADDKFNGNGVNYHIVSVFVEELRPFLPVKLEVVGVLFGTFVSVMGGVNDKVLLGKVKSNVFEVLVKKGRELLEAKKSGKEGGVVDSSTDVLVLGSVALEMGFSAKFYELGSSPECVQGNRKVLLGLHQEFEKLEKDLASSGVDISVPKAVENVEEEVPLLVPIVSDEIEVVSASEPVEAGADVVGDFAEVPSLKKGNGKKSKGLSGADNVSKKSKKKKKNKKKNRVDANGVELMNESISDEDLVPLNESALTNLQLQFEKIAAEAGLDDDLPNSSTVTSKKRKRAKAMNGKQQPNDSVWVEEEEDAGVAMSANGAGEKSAKKVKFSMKNNLVWKPHNPLPPQSLRLPPSATPRGSALKKGVPPGPIREIPAQPKKARVRVVSVKKARKKAVKRLKKLKTLST